MKLIKGFAAMLTASVCILGHPGISRALVMDARMSDAAYEATMEHGSTYGICPELLQALIETESSGNPDAVNGGCKGLCQVYEKYHHDRMARLGVWDLYDGWGNILVAADYISELLAEHGDVCLALDHYNGNSNAEQNFEQGIVSDYAARILKRSAELEWLHGK